MRHETPGRSKNAAPAAPAQPAADFPRPMGATPVDGGEWPHREPGASARNFSALLDLAGSDSLAGHVGNAAQIISLAHQLGEPLDAQQLTAIRRRLLAALMIVEGVA